MHWFSFEYKGLDAQASYYFDRGEPFEPVFKAKWEREAAREEINIWSHVKHVGSATMKETPGLQIADMLAWANNRKEANISQRYDKLALAMTRLMPSHWIIWGEANLKRIYKPLIYKPYEQY
jgi:hypothetical protein